ncbi:hypothetical protein BPOR_0010g00040 [Botrytis porri]|uniref:Uncharacterized protein n=1 Tax=Botrytis porri TaxID=87229 RepID=A0A4Z1L5J4_9HELO|nr:hypothetical protein BPOR_0010g00040 [Botrytis porri]
MILLAFLHAHTFAAFDSSEGPWGTQTTAHECYLASATPFFHILDKGHLQLSRYLVRFVTKNWAASIEDSEACFREFPMRKTMAFFLLTIYMDFDQEEMREFIMAFGWQNNTRKETLVADEYPTAQHQRSFLRMYVLLLSKEAPLSAYPGEQYLYSRQLAKMNIRGSIGTRLHA